MTSAIFSSRVAVANRVMKVRLLLRCREVCRRQEEALIRVLQEVERAKEELCSEEEKTDE